MDLFSDLLGALLVDASSIFFTDIGLPRWLVILLSDGAGGGIQTLSTFIPPIALIYLCLSFMEDSGYMARVAFVMDRFCRKIGLPGKAFIPLIVGFGCTVPAVLSTRTLEDEKDRKITMLIVPFISCGARLPVYAVFISVFFRHNAAFMLSLLHLIGIAVAICSAIILKRTVLKGEPDEFVMELPPYHVPTAEGILYHTWHRLKDFVIRAGKLIITAVIIVRFLSGLNSPSEGKDNQSDNIVQKTGKIIQPVFAPMGISQDNWPAAIALVSGIFSKESVIGTLNSIYLGIDSENENQKKSDSDMFCEIRKAIIKFLKYFAFQHQDIEDSGSQIVRDNDANSGIAKYFKSPLAAFAYMIFVLLYTPCIAVIAVIQREAGTKWAVFSVVYQTLLAYTLSVIVFQTGKLMAVNNIPIVFCLLLLGCAIFLAVEFNKRPLKNS